MKVIFMHHIGLTNDDQKNRVSGTNGALQKPVPETKSTRLTFPKMPQLTHFSKHRIPSKMPVSTPSNRKLQLQITQTKTDAKALKFQALDAYNSLLCIYPINVFQKPVAPQYL